MSGRNRLNRFGKKSPLRKFIQFELDSLKCRYFFRNTVKIEPYINIGCGPNILPGFTNVDFYSSRNRDRVFGHDLRYPFPFPDAVFEGAFSEHVLEHLNPEDAQALLQEIYRILKPGSVFRCIVPDLETYLRFYAGERLEGFEQFGSGCEALSVLAYGHGHQALWDAAKLERQLREAGFGEVSRQLYREGRDAALLQDQETRKWDSLYMEAVK